MSMKHTGFTLVKMLKAYGVEYIFGIPGGQTLPLYDAIDPKHGGDIKHVMMRDERSAGHAACAYARFSGKVGVCDATVGPGATNLPSALGEALNSSTPVIAIVGEHPVDWIDRIELGRASQGIDQISLLEAVTKKVLYVPSQESFPSLVKTAFLVATTGRPGPVVLDIPADVFRESEGPSSLEYYINPDFGRFPAVRTSPDPAEIDRAVELLWNAERPVMLVGGGGLISGASHQVQELAELLTMPVTTTHTGKGILSGEDPLNMGYTTTTCAEEVLRSADVVFMVGAKASQFSTFEWSVPTQEQKVIHLDVDPQGVGRIFSTDVGLVGDAKLGLEAILDSMKQGGKISKKEERMSELRNLKEAWKKKVAELSVSDDVPINPHVIMVALNKVMDPEDSLVCDAGFASSWGSLYYHKHKAGRCCTFPRGLAGLGFSVAAGIGAQLAVPDNRVVTLAGDGAFTYVMADLATQAELNLPVVNIVMNNSAFGWVKWAEKAWYEDSFSASDLSRIDFAKVAEGLGCVGLLVEEPSEVEEVLDEALSLRKPVVVEVITDATTTP